MATYLCVKANNTTKKYEVKSSANKPYVRVSTGYLPLTTQTDTNTGLRFKQGGSTYRVVETYTTTISVNTSSTNTYYRTSSNFSIVAQGTLSSTTLFMASLKYSRTTAGTLNAVATIAALAESNILENGNNDFVSCNLTVDYSVRTSILGTSQSFKITETISSSVSKSMWIGANQRYLGIMGGFTFSVNSTSKTSNSIGINSLLITKTHRYETSATESLGSLYTSFIFNTYQRFDRFPISSETGSRVYISSSKTLKTYEYYTVSTNDRTSTSYYTIESTITSG